MALLHRRKDIWNDVDPKMTPRLTDARLQLHHAAQLVAAIGISYLPKAADDSHTNMEWLGGTLASNLVGARPFRLGVRPNPFALVVVVGDVELTSVPLHGKKIDDAASWVRGQLQSLDVNPARYTLAKHYTIPDHPVARGAPFDASDSAAFEQLNRWYDDADLVLRRLAERRADASAVRCWPHHFDIATLLTVAPGRTIGIGLEPGDVYYDEPYWYVNTYPAPSAPPAAALDGGGSWHTHEWIGAVLPGSRTNTTDQRAQAERFIDSAVRALS